MENYLDLLIPLHGKKEALEDALNALEKVTSSKLHYDTSLCFVLAAMDTVFD